VSKEECHVLGFYLNAIIAGKMSSDGNLSLLIIGILSFEQDVT